MLDPSERHDTGVSVPGIYTGRRHVARQREVKTVSPLSLFRIRALAAQEEATAPPEQEILLIEDSLIDYEDCAPFADAHGSAAE